MEQAIYLVVGAALTWAFYFIQRTVERRKTVDAIERSQQLLALKQGLEGAETSLDELRRFERRLIGKAETAVRIADGYVSQAERVARQRSDEALSQGEMGRQAVARFRSMDARLEVLVARLRLQLDGADRTAFEAAHRAWLAFRERYARFIAECYCSGAAPGAEIRPLIHAVTLESLSASWITELETQLGDEESLDLEGEVAPVPE